MSGFRQLHAGLIGEAPVTFYKRDEAFPECPWVAVVDILRALALPEQRDAAVIASMSRDYVGGVLTTDDGRTLMVQPIAGDMVRAAQMFGKKFDPEAWCLQFAAASEKALQRILLRLPLDHRALYADTARANTWALGGKEVKNLA